MGATAWPFRCCSQAGVQRALPGQLPVGGSPPPDDYKRSGELEEEYSAAADRQHEEMYGVWAADLRHCSRPLKLRCMADRGEAPSPCAGIGELEAPIWDSSQRSSGEGALLLPEEHFCEAAVGSAPSVEPGFPDFLSVSGSEIRGLDGIYRCWPARNHNGLPVWEKANRRMRSSAAIAMDQFAAFTTAETRRLLFYSSKKARWYISDKIEDKGFAFATSGAESPVGLAWSNGTTVQDAPDCRELDFYTSELSFKNSYMRFTAISRLLPRISPQAWKTSSCASGQECKRGEELESEVSGASTATGGSTNLRQKRGMMPLAVKTTA